MSTTSAACTPGDLTVAPGETVLIEMRAQFDWPEGQILSWLP